MPKINRPPVNSNNDDEHYEVLVKGQTNNDKNHDTSRNDASFLLGSTVVVQEKIMDQEPMAQWWGEERIPTTTYIT